MRVKEELERSEMVNIYIVRLLCVLCTILAILTAIFFVAFLIELKEKEHWHTQAEFIAEGLRMRCEKADDIERENNELNRELSRRESDDIRNY